MVLLYYCTTCGEKHSYYEEQTSCYRTRTLMHDVTTFDILRALELLTELPIENSRVHYVVSSVHCQDVLF